MQTTFSMIIIVLSSLNVLLNMCGSCLLVIVYRTGTVDANPQHIFIINLAVTQMLIGAVNLVRALFVPKSIEHHLTIFRIFSLNTTLYLTMIFITLDKLIEIYLNIKYSLYWNEKKTKWLLLATWTINVTLALVITLTYHFTDEISLLNPIGVYYVVVFDILFALVAVITYGYIFEKYRQTRIQPSRHTSTTRPPQQSAFSIFVNSKFYLSAMLIVTFMLFSAVPHFTIFVVYVAQRRSSILGLNICMVFMELSHIIDAFTYIFMKPSIKKLLKKKMLKSAVRQSTTSRTSTVL